MPLSLKNLQNALTIQAHPKRVLCKYWQRIFAALVISLGVTLTGAVAQEPGPAGILDQLPDNPSKGSATQDSLSAQEAAVLAEQRQQLVRAEYDKLQLLAENELVKLAENGQRGAQLVLAEQFAGEAISQSITVVSANAAMSDAAFWYARAARRGVPGAINVDGALPLFPLRAVRSD